MVWNSYMRLIWLAAYQVWFCDNRKITTKNPTIFYFILYHGSWNNYIQSSNPRALSTWASCLTLSYKNWQITCSIYYLQIACLHCAILMGTSNVCVVTFVQPIMSQLIVKCPFHLHLNWVSTGSDMHAINSIKYLVSCEATNCELTNN